MIFVPNPIPRDAREPPALTCCINVRDHPMATSCGQRGGLLVAAAIERELDRRCLDIGFSVIRCHGRCSRGPAVKLSPGDTWFLGVQLEDVARLVEIAQQHIAGRRLS